MLQDLLSDLRSKYQINGKETYYNAFMEEQKIRQLKDSQDNAFSDQAMLANMQLFMLAGTQPVAAALTWFLVYMMTYPDVQSNIQREIDTIYGADNDPSISKQSMTPYTRAAIAEVLRLTSFQEMIMPHRNKTETFVQGFCIPKDTVILANMWAVQNDPKTFTEPHLFRPEHFLDNQGQYVQPDNFVPFGLGKRRCIGEQLAKMELYLYVVALLQSFTFRSPNGVVPCFEATQNITPTPKTFVTQALPRH